MGGRQSKISTPNASAEESNKSNHITVDSSDKYTLRVSEKLLESNPKSHGAPQSSPTEEVLGAIYTRGYQEGVAYTTQVNSEIHRKDEESRAARALESEQNLSHELERRVKSLKAQRYSVPTGPTACIGEEKDVVTCYTTTDGSSCEGAIKALEECVRKALLEKAKHPH